MKKNTRAVYTTSRAFPLSMAIIAFVMLLTILPMRGYAALCAKPEKSTTYINGYDAAQSDFHDGRPQSQNVTSANSQYGSDYKQGYKDGWNDAQYNVNVIQNSVC